MIANDKLRTIGESTGKYWTYGEKGWVNIPPVDGPQQLQEKSGEFWFHQPYVVELHNVELAGPAMVGFYEGDVILESAYAGRLDVFERNKPYFDMAISIRNGCNPERLEGKYYCPFIGVWSNNYFHWTLEYLPRLEGLKAWENATGKKATILLGAKPKPWQTESIRKLGFQYERAECAYYVVEHMVLPTTRREIGRVNPGAVQWLRAATAGIKDRYYTSPKVYITRREARSRRIVNEEEVMDALLNQGYSVIMPEYLTWSEQVKHFKGSEVIISPHGAGLVNVVYAEHPSIVEIFAPSYVNPCYYTLAGIMGWDYRCIVGESRGVEDIYVREELLQDGIITV